MIGEEIAMGNAQTRNIIVMLIRNRMTIQLIDDEVVTARELEQLAKITLANQCYRSLPK